MRRSAAAKYSLCGILCLATICVTASVYGQTKNATVGREKFLFDRQWRFMLGNAKNPDQDFGYGTSKLYAKAGELQGPAVPGFNDGDWRMVDLPHDWAVELEFKNHDDDDLLCHGFRPVGIQFPESSVGWYRKTFILSPSDRQKKVYLQFDGVFRNAKVFVNGFELAVNQSGYSGFTVDMTDVAHFRGKNVVVVRVDASQYEGWYYEGAGIYRHVWLVKTEPTHIESDSLWGRTKIEGDRADVTAACEIANDSAKEVRPVVVFSLVDAAGKAVATATAASQSIPPGKKADVQANLKLDSPRLWSLEDPYLYRLISTVSLDGKEVDRLEVNHGVRSILWDAQQGFLLNGKRTQIQGMCCHQDHAGVGVALPDRLQSFRLERLKEMGCNAYRSAHNPPTPELLDACDRLGILVMVENRLAGSNPEVLSQLTRMIRRDRSHPSVVIWSLCNEEWRIQGTTTGTRIAESMKRAASNLDDTRPFTAAMSGGWGWGLTFAVDVFGCNYKTHGDIDALHRDIPHLPIVFSEEGSTLCTRGEYVNDPQKGYLGAYDVNAPDFGATAEGWLKYVMERPYVAGAFIWSGFDYRGEPTPYCWPCVSSHFGVLDTCGFPKDNFYFYQAWWTDKPMLHLLPHWNWSGKEGKDVNVRCFSNCDEVELFLNGKSLGKQSTPRYSHLQWNVPYQPGELSAKGYKNGKIAVDEKQETAGAPFAVRLQADRSKIRADGEDVCVVTASIVDEKARFVPTANNEILLSLSGSAQIIGVGNGDPSSHEADVYPRRVPTKSLKLSAWKMKDLPRLSLPEKPDAAIDLKDVREVNVTAMEGQLKPNQSALFVTEFILTEDDLRADECIFSIGSIDDDGWLYINGKSMGDSHDWSESPCFEIRSALKPGKNVFALYVKNNAGPGGLSRGASLTLYRSGGQWKRSAFNGLAQILVQAKDKPGQIILKANAEGLKTGEITIELQPATPRPSL